MLSVRCKTRKILVKEPILLCSTKLSAYSYDIYALMVVCIILLCRAFCVYILHSQFCINNHYFKFYRI